MEAPLAALSGPATPTSRNDSPGGSVGSYRRLLTLPAVLARHRTAGARVEQGELQVRFEENVT